MSQNSTLDSLRSQIDECDQSLLEILAKRQQLVEQLVQLKRLSGDALFVPEREQAIFDELARKAQCLGLQPDFVQDVMHRIMRDSYQRQSNMQFSSPDGVERTICILGGEGQMGSLFADLFRRSGHRVYRIEPDDWKKSDRWFQSSDLILIAVPIDATQTVIERLANLPESTVLADITSIKQQPLEAMLKVHAGPVLGLHPMFGPGLSHLARQLVLYVEGRDKTSAQWLLEQLAIWGCRLQEVDAMEHDKAMALVQAQRHLVAFVAGWQLMDNNTSLQELWRMSSPPYRLELLLIGRMFAQSPELYVDILLNACQANSVLEDFASLYQQAHSWLVGGERESLIEQFKKVAGFFSAAEQEYLQQSDKLLEAFRERI